MSEFPHARVFGATATATAPEMRVVGRSWAVLPCFVSALSILRRSQSERDEYLDLAAATGWNGIRVFAGALTWASQTPEMARERLPELLDACSARGLAAEVTAVTDSATGYDWRWHLSQVAVICAGRHALVEGANEIGHSTQARDVTPDSVANELRIYGREYGVPWAVGAPGQDEPLNGAWPAGQGAYSTAHLDRGRDRWEQVRRVRELYAVMELTGKPCIDNEPIGADETRNPGKRENDPALFACLGALDAAFGGGGVHHSQSGLHATLPGPIQQQCANAYVKTFKTLADFGLGSYRNVGYIGSPVVWKDNDRVVRIYSFVRGHEALSVHIGESIDTALYARGWKAVDTLHHWSGHDGLALRVVKLEQS